MQKPITDYKEIAWRIMCNLNGKNSDHLPHNYDTYNKPTWDTNSPAHRFWLRYCKKNFRRLMNYAWYQIYREARDEIKLQEGTL
jgi:hypothetical protein